MRKWGLPRDLLMGSEGMREGSDPTTGDEWLPRYSAEEPEDYIKRRRATILHGLFSGGVDRLASQPFGKQVQITEPDRLDARFWEDGDGSTGYLADVDGDGTSLTDFARKAYEDATAYGITHALALHTAKDEEDRDGRPILEHVPALSLIGWIHDDANRLIDCRVSGSIVERDPDNPWKEVELDTVRRYFLAPVTGEAGEDLGEGVWTELYVVDEENKKRKNRGAMMEPREPATLLANERGEVLEEIPLFTLYFRKTGTMEAEPPLFALAEANLDHFRAKSDYDNAVHGAAVPMLSMVGIAKSSGDDDEVTQDSEEKISVTRVLKSSRADARFEWVEISGTACEAARQRVLDIEARAESLGGQPKTRAGVGTATAVWVDERASEGRVSSWNRATEAFLDLCIWAMGEWMGSTVPEDVRANIPEDRPLTQGRLDEVNAILAVLKTGGLLKRETALSALQSVIPSLEQIDAAEEVEAAQSEWGVAGMGDGEDEFGAGVDMDEDEENDDGDE